MLNSDFVDAFIEDFNAKVHIMMYGANKCRELSSLLSQMYQDNKLYREAVGLNEMCSGFPKWIYTYRLRESNCRDIIAELNERL